MPQRRLAAAILFASIVGLAVTATAQQASGPDHPANKAFMGAMQDMMAGMHANMPTGDTDTDFVRMMLSHHQAAVDMAKAELQYGKDEGLKAMAKEIVTAQKKEIALMKAWEDRKKTSH